MFDVLPEGLCDDGPGLRVDSQQAGQPRVQLELRRLVVQQQQDRTAHVLVARTLHLAWSEQNVRIAQRVLPSVSVGEICLKGAVSDGVIKPQSSFH